VGTVEELVEIWPNEVCDREVSLDYMLIKEIMADIFTKTLSYESFEKFQTNLGVLHTI